MPAPGGAQAAVDGRDDDAFRREVEPFRRELLAHCYRMVGSLHDAEDAYQETLIRAWRARDRFEGRSSLRTWLHRIATNVCLDAIADRKTGIVPEQVGGAGAADAPPPAPDLDPAWLQPFPDQMLGDTALGPEARYSARESVTIAFMIALHLLPPRQRAVLLMRDVLGLSADETADALEMTVAAANSALQRARATLDEHGAAVDALPPASAAGDLLARYVAAWASGDMAALIAVLRDDAVLSMPPMPLWIAGARAIAAFYDHVLRGLGPFTLRPLAVNGQPGFAVYGPKAGAEVFEVITVLTVAPAGDRIVAMHSFLQMGGWLDPAAYGVPAVLDR